MDKCDSLGTPLATKPKLDADLSGTPVDQTKYHSKIGSLMYLTSSRPDIVQAGTINIGLSYLKDSSFELTAFLYANHAGCIDTRKSTSGGIQFLGDKLVSWMSKKQDRTAMSSAEAEYVALSASCAQVMWTRKQLKDYGFDYNKIPLYCDSQSAIAISRNPVQHSRTKHIHTLYHFIKEQVERGSYALRWKPCQGDSSKLNLLDTCQSSQNQRYQDYQDKDCQGSLLASFQDDAKYEHVGQDTIRQCGKDKEKQGKDLKILGLKTKSKDNDKGSRSKITQHEGTSL
ncbi:hypothetical protein Tco_0914730 [Tanacetum coccineum]